VAGSTSECCNKVGVLLEKVCRTDVLICVGEFRFLCNVNHFNPLQSLYIFVSFCSRNKR